jgi:hypothetical protein
VRFTKRGYIDLRSHLVYAAELALRHRDERDDGYPVAGV